MVRSGFDMTRNPQPWALNPRDVPRQYAIFVDAAATPINAKTLNPKPYIP